MHRFYLYFASLCCFAFSLTVSVFTTLYRLLYSIILAECAVEYFLIKQLKKPASMSNCIVYVSREAFLYYIGDILPGELLCIVVVSQ